MVARDGTAPREGKEYYLEQEFFQLSLVWGSGTDKGYYILHPTGDGPRLPRRSGSEGNFGPSIPTTAIET